MNPKTLRLTLLPGLLALALASLACERPPVEAEQHGFRGVAMERVTNPRLQARTTEANQIPEPQPPVAASGVKAGAVYQNVQVLGDLDVAQFSRLMAAITAWVAPEQGCNYCHAAGESLASDKLYTKAVSRRMIQMTQAVNSEWTDHVADTGVTCWTCHRGQPVPQYYWFQDPGSGKARMVGSDVGQNVYAPAAGGASLPRDPFSPFLKAEPRNIRVQSGSALPTGSATSIKDAEYTYALMMHLSTSLGVNCTYCHNSRAFAPWEESLPTRITAWHGLAMVRDVNVEYIASLHDVFPDNRKGPAGDVFKANCATCHQGLPKPLGGVSMLPDYPSLRGAAKAPEDEGVSSQAMR